MIDFLIVVGFAIIGLAIYWIVRQRSERTIQGYINPDGSGKDNWIE